MRITIDMDCEPASMNSMLMNISLSDATVCETVPNEDASVMADYDKDGRLVGVEVIDGWRRRTIEVPDWIEVQQ